MRWPVLILVLLGTGLLLWPRAGVSVRVDGRPVLWFPTVEGERFELSWRHSVSGIVVRDVFAVEDGRIYLEETHNPWFAAGLGEVEGRGRVVAEANHAVAIVDIHELADDLKLRIGRPEIHHTLWIRGRGYDFSACFSHRRLTWSLDARPWLLALFPAKDPCL